MTGMLGYAEKLRHRSQTKGNLAYSFARTLDALAAWHQDQPEQALKALDDAQFQPHWWDAVQSAFSYQALNRYVRAEVLYEQERYEEALPWYASLHDGYGYWGMFYLGLSYLRRAEIYENLGDTENAIKYYTRFLELWRDADPELQSDWVEPARQRLERLLEGTVREPGEVVRPGGSS